MPLSTNAQNDDKGFSMVLRDIEHLYLMLQQQQAQANGVLTGNTVGEGDGQGTNDLNGNVQPPTEGTRPVSITGPRGPRGPQGVAGVTPLGPGGETMTIQTITACVDGVEKTMYIYGYVVP